MKQETFTNAEIQNAITVFLEYGENTYAPCKEDGELGHGGYFSGSGWAARCLRYHLQQLKEKNNYLN